MYTSPCTESVGADTEGSIFMNVCMLWLLSKMSIATSSDTYQSVGGNIGISHRWIMSYPHGEATWTKQDIHLDCWKGWKLLGLRLPWGLSWHLSKMGLFKNALQLPLQSISVGYMQEIGVRATESTELSVRTVEAKVPTDWRWNAPTEHSQLQEREESSKITGPSRKLDSLGGRCQPDHDSPTDSQAAEEMGQAAMPSWKFRLLLHQQRLSINDKWISMRATPKSCTKAIYHTHWWLILPAPSPKAAVSYIVLFLNRSCKVVLPPQSWGLRKITGVAPLHSSFENPGRYRRERFLDIDVSTVS